MPKLSFWLNWKNINHVSTYLQKHLSIFKMIMGKQFKSQSLSNNYLSAYISRNDFLSIFHSFGAMCVHERYERDIHRVSIFLTIRRYNMLTPSSIHFFSLLYINEKIYIRTENPRYSFSYIWFLPGGSWQK